MTQSTTTKFTKGRLNSMISFATGIVFINPNANRLISGPNWCKILGITQADIQKMNKRIKQFKKEQQDARNPKSDTKNRANH